MDSTNTLKGAVRLPKPPPGLEHAPHSSWHTSVFRKNEDYSGIVPLATPNCLEESDHDGLILPSISSLKQGKDNRESHGIHHVGGVNDGELSLSVQATAEMNQTEMDRSRSDTNGCLGCPAEDRAKREAQAVQPVEMAIQYGLFPKHKTSNKCQHGHVHRHILEGTQGNRAGGGGSSDGGSGDVDDGSGKVSFHQMSAINQPVVSDKETGEHETNQNNEKNDRRNGMDMGMGMDMNMSQESGYSTSAACMDERKATSHVADADADAAHLVEVNRHVPHGFYDGFLPENDNKVKACSAAPRQVSTANVGDNLKTEGTQGTKKPPVSWLQLDLIDG